MNQLLNINFFEIGCYICLLYTSVPNQPYSENITVTRIVDAYLEHSRVWYFYNAGREDVYLASADWMERNLCLLYTSFSFH